MKNSKVIEKLVTDESGAVTVDWVLITAAVASMGVLVLLVIAPGLNPVTAKVEPATDNAPGLGARLISGSADTE